MFDYVDLVYSISLNIWIVYVNGEWYFESEDQEQAEHVYAIRAKEAIAALQG